MSKYTAEQLLSGVPVDIADDPWVKSAIDLIRERESAQVPSLVYVPGMWRCAKCDFVLLQSNLNADSGAVTPRDKPGDACPNCATALWRVTYRDAYADVMKLFEDHIARERERESAPVVPKLPASGTGFVKLCIYERRHGTFATLGGQVLFGAVTSPTGQPTRTYEIPLDYLRGIIEHAVRTGEPE